MKRMLSMDEGCEILGISVPHGYDLAKQGILPVVRVGRRVRICPDQLSEFIKAGGKALPGGWRRHSSDRGEAA